MAMTPPEPAGSPSPGPPNPRDTTRELSRAQREHEALIDSVDGIVWEADASFRFTCVSRRAERLLGYPLRRWYQEPDFWVTHLHPDDRERAASHCREAAEQCLPHELEYRMLASDGRVVWLRDIVTVLEEDGRPHRLRGIMVDITEQRRTRERMERTVSLLEATLDSTADGLLVVNLGGDILACNRQFKHIWGLDEARYGSRDAPLLQAALGKVKEPERFLARVRSLYATPEQESFDVVELRDGRVLERYSLPQRQGGVITGRVWSFRDVSPRVQAERERERLLRDAHEAIQVRDDFLSIASHELKTPLTPLRLQLQMLKQALESGRSVTPERVDKALRQVRRLSALVNDLLDASCVGAGQMELQRAPLSLPELVREVFSDFRAASETHALTYEGPAEDVLVSGDRGRLAQVLTNLLENALKYSPLGGVVRVTLTHSGGDAVVSVVDSGIGIPKEEQAHLFERFFRARNAPVSGFGGLGLGLYICRDIIERHGGHIWVESELGRGTTFEVVLPATPDLVPAADSRRPDPKSPPVAGSRLMVIDDEPLLTTALSRMLEPEHEVETFTSARKALERLRAGEEYALILCDLMMPEMTGMELHKTLAHEAPGLAERMVFITGGAFTEAGRTFLNTTHRPWLEKPFEPESLRANIRTLLVSQPSAAGARAS